MATIVTRAGKGSTLTHAEMDANFNNLNNDKVEKTSSSDNSIAKFNGTSGELQDTGVNIDDQNVVRISATNTGTGWNTSNLIVNSANKGPSISLHAQAQSSAGIFKYGVFSGNQRFELRNSGDEGYLKLVGNSLPILSGNVTGGNEADLVTNFENRLQYTFVHSDERQGRVFAVLNASISRAGGTSTDFEMFCRLYDVTSATIIYDGPISGVSDTGQYNLSYNQQFTCGFEWTGTLTNGHTYNLELQIRKNQLNGPYYPRKMSIIAQLS